MVEPVSIPPADPACFSCLPSQRRRPHGTNGTIPRASTASTANQDTVEDLRAELDRLRESRRQRRPSGASTSTDQTGHSHGGVTHATETETCEDIAEEIREKLAKPEKQLRMAPKPINMSDAAAEKLSSTVLKVSALGKQGWVQVLIYQAALAGVIFVLIATAVGLGASDSGASASEASGASDGAHHRRLGGETPPTLKHIAYCLVCSGMVSYLAYFASVPLFLGYLIGGVVVGPAILHLVPAAEDLYEIGTLGSLFLLFMIGLEVDTSVLLKTGDRISMVTGVVQYPVNAAIVYVISEALTSCGLDFGDSAHAPLYVGLGCSMASSMLLERLLKVHSEEDRPNGRLASRISFLQDAWVPVVLTLQPSISSADTGKMLQDLVMLVFLSCVGFFYAKFVMPAVLYYAKNSVELMLVLALAWCFFMCMVAVQPWVDLSMEIASLIAGMSLGAFPFSNDFNSKIKYIRDFFAAIFFAWIGMQISVDSFGSCLGKAVVLSIVVLGVRWISVGLVVLTLGGPVRMAMLATMNLSSMSETGLVIAMLGLKFGQVDSETSAVMILTFCILTALAPMMVSYKHTFVNSSRALMRDLLGKGSAAFQNLFAGDSGELNVPQEEEEETDDDEHEDRRIVLLGFHKIAFMLIAEFKVRNPEYLKKIHVLYDSNADMMGRLREQGILCTSCDISSRFEIHKKIKHTPDIIICSSPDITLQGVTNMQLLGFMKELFPKTIKIVSADNPECSGQLYKEGADYVLRTARLVAERLYDLVKQYLRGGDNGELANMFETFKKGDQLKFKRGNSFFNMM